MAAFRSTVATAPSPASSGTSLIVAAGDGASAPATPFPAIIWGTGSGLRAGSYEVVTVSTVSTDTFTIARAGRGTSARTVVVGDIIRALNASQLRTDALWTTGDMDFRESSGLWLPSAAGLVPLNGQLGYDSTLDSVVSASLGNTMRSWRLFAPAILPTADSLVSTVNTEQTFATTIALPANFFKALKPVRVTASFIYIGGGTPSTVTLKLKLGSTVYASAASAGQTSVTGHGFTYEWVLMAAAAPAGSVNVHTGAPVGALISGAARNTTTQPVALATNGGLTLSMTCTFTTANSTDTLTLDQLFVSEMG